MFSLKTTPVLTEEANCVKSDVERSGTHAVVDS